jgi:hypothetical protein
MQKNPFSAGCPLLEEHQAPSSSGLGADNFEEIDLSAEAEYERGYLDEVEKHRRNAAAATAARRRTQKVSSDL